MVNISCCRRLFRPREVTRGQATSALDAESEEAVQVSLRELMKGRTVMTIAHRLSTMKVDIVFVEGRQHLTNCRAGMRPCGCDGGGRGAFAAASVDDADDVSHAALQVIEAGEFGPLFSDSSSR
jgi:hypothetical protein